MNMLRMTLAAASIGLLAFPLTAKGEPAEKPDRAARREAMLKKFDANGNGKLDGDEREKMRAEMQKRREAGGQKGSRGERRAEMLKKFDKDGDGKLSEEERSAMRAAMKGQQGKNAKPKKKAE